MTARRWRDPEYEPVRPQPVSDLPLFATPVREMARRGDPDTSKAAALAISETLSNLQARVWTAFSEHGDMSAKQAECLPEFADLGFSTVRKRCSEGLRAGWLRATGEIRDGCMVYALREVDK